ncbi:MAG: HAD family hydrolase [Pseudomonadota bacterium]
MRWVASRLDFALERTLVAGVTAADADMLMGNTMGVVVDSQHLAELSGLVNMERIYFSGSRGAAGIMEAMQHYDFFKDCGEKT